MANLIYDWTRLNPGQKIALLDIAIGVRSTVADDWWSWDGFGRLLEQVAQRDRLPLVESSLRAGQTVYSVTIDTDDGSFETPYGADLRERLLLAFCLASKVEIPNEWVAP